MRGAKKAAVGSWQLAGCGLQVAGCRLQVAGYRLQVPGYRLQVVGCRLQVPGLKFLVICYLSFVICHLLFVICHLLFVICTWLFKNRGWKLSQLRASRFALHTSGFLLSSVFGLFLIFSVLSLSAQNNPYLYQVNSYNFIRSDLNELYNFGNDRYSSNFYNKLETLLRTGEGRINVIQIGGSHIQAGTFSGQIRSRLQQMNGEMNAGWGFMFPYRIARTNSPFGYYIRYSGNWQSCRNVETRKSCTLGVGGISATTSSPKAELTILLEPENVLDYRFNKLRVFYEDPDDNYTVSVDSLLLRSVVRTNEYFDFELNTYVDSLNLFIQRPDTLKGSFTLFGITTESAPNGFLYHSIGVNGAQVPSFLRCELFEKQLAILKPDLVILGLGINDAYGKRFSQREYEANYGLLISRIRRAAPETAIIFITNNDSYLYRRYVNKNGEKAGQSMFKVADEINAGVWDMYRVMGGLNSVVLWEKNQLAQNDKIHFTREGYLLLGDLFFNALMKNFEKYLQEKNALTASDK